MPARLSHRGRCTSSNIPGTVVAADVTSKLELGYWPSYNVPYFDEIYKKSGYVSLDERKGKRAGSEYQLAPRASIFRRDSGSAKDMDSLKHLMRENGWSADSETSDPFAADAWGAICSRGGLVPGNKAAFEGCYDSKVTSATMMRESGGIFAINGPTAQRQPAFGWSSAEMGRNASGFSSLLNAAQPAPSKVKHLGQPDLFDFQYEMFIPFWRK